MTFEEFDERLDYVLAGFKAFDYVMPLFKEDQRVIGAMQKKLDWLIQEYKALVDNEPVNYF